MNILRIIATLTIVCLSGAMMFAADTRPGPGKKATSPAVDKKQTGQSSIIVNGRALTGPNSAAQNRGGQIMIPVATLARSLGDTLTHDLGSRTISVRRQDNTSAAFHAGSGQVVENGAIILAASAGEDVVLTANPDEMMLPPEIVSALFGVSIRFDTLANAVLIDRGRSVGAAMTRSGGRGPFELYQASYEYNLNRYSSAYSQNLTLTAAGRLWDGRFNFTANSSAVTLRHFSPRNVTLDLERPNGQRFVAGDFGSGSALPLIAGNVRGGMVSIPAAGFTLAGFAGRANSGVRTEDFGIQQVAGRRGYRYDTTVAGIYAIAPRFESGLLKPLTVTAGLMSFRSQTRNGSLFSTSVNYAGRALRFQADAGIGTFERRLAGGARLSGLSGALDLSATYQIADDLSVQGRYAHIGANFLTPQAGVREPVDIKAAGITWSPKKWLTASLNGSTARRPNDTGRGESFATAAFSITPAGQRTRIYFSHTASSSKLYSNGSFTLLNASKDFHRWRLFGNATRIKTIGPTTMSAQFGTNLTVNDANSIEVSQGFGGHRTLNGLVDWRTSSLLNKKLSFTAGMGYSYSPASKLDPFGKLTAGLRLPRETSVQISYMHTTSGPNLLVQLRGTLFRRKAAAAYLNASAGEAQSFAAARGRVYQDVDGNGQYDVGTDKPQPQVKVRVDGNRYVETDVNGLFNFEALRSGSHQIYIDLLSVRADLTIVDAGTRELELKGGKTADVEFRLVRTGRISGRVFFDKDGNGKMDQGELPLGDVRIVTASGRDTLTDSDGYFTIADLAPGEHTVSVDEKTIPEKTVAGAKPITVRVFAGRETSDIVLTAVERPAEVKRFGAAK